MDYVRLYQESLERNLKTAGLGDILSGVGNTVADFTYRPVLKMHESAGRLGDELRKSWAPRGEQFNAGAAGRAALSTAGNAAGALTNIFGFGVGGLASKGLKAIGLSRAAGALGADVAAAEASRHIPTKLFTGTFLQGLPGETLLARMRRYLANTGIVAGNTALGMGADMPQKALPGREAIK